MREQIDELRLNRMIGVAEAAEFLNLSIPHLRDLYRTGKVPMPIRIGGRKLGWRLRDLLDIQRSRMGEAA